MENFQKLLVKLTNAVSYKYPGACAPSVIVSSLSNNEYYVSIVKYGSSHKDKMVLHKAYNKDLCRAVEAVTQQFLSATNAPTNPIEELKEYVTESSKWDAIRLNEERIRHQLVNSDF